MLGVSLCGARWSSPTGGCEARWQGCCKSWRPPLISSHDLLSPRVLAQVEHLSNSHSSCAVHSENSQLQLSSLQVSCLRVRKVAGLLSPRAPVSEYALLQVCGLVQVSCLRRSKVPGLMSPRAHVFESLQVWLECGSVLLQVSVQRRSGEPVNAGLISPSVTVGLW